MQHKDQITTLVERAVKGDRDAMSDLYSQTCQRTYRTILGLVRDEQTAQDLTQETYMAAFSGLKRLEDPARFQPWLISTAVHKSKNHLRSARPVLFSELEDSAAVENLPDVRAEASPEISLDRAETTRIVRELLGELNESQRLAVELFYYDQLSTTEISQSLEIPQSTVKTQLHYARKKLEAGLRRLQSKGVELGGLTAAGCFGLLRSLPEEPVLPRRQAEAMLSNILEQAPVQVAAKTGKQLLRGSLGKLLLGALGVAAAGGLVLGGLKLFRHNPEVGDVQPTEPSIVQLTETEALPAADYASDYESLWTVLEQDYPYLPYLEAQGTDMESLKSYYQEQAALAKTPEAYLSVLRSLIENRLNLTGSLQVFGPEEFRLNMPYQDPPEDAELTSYQAAWYALLQDPRLSPLYDWGEGGRDNPAAGMDASFSNPPTVRWYEDEKALLLFFPNCIVPNIDRDREVVAKALAEHPEAKNLIVDLRGCHGGEADYWAPVLLEPLGGDWSWTTRAYYRDTPTTAPFYADEDSHPVSELENPPEWVAELKLDRWYEIEMASHSPLPETGMKRWVLTNGQTYSGAAWLAGFCRASGWATVVGGPTSTSYGLARAAVGVILPESGLVLQFGEVVESPDGGLYQDTGILPDLPCEPKHALNTCLDLIRAGE